MTSNSETIRQRVAQLEALRTTLGDAAVDAAIAALQAEATAADPPAAPAGTAQVSGEARVYGPTVGVNLGTIIYGHALGEDARQRLVWYLDALANTLRRLPLRGLDTRLDEGQGVALAHVYVMLATTAKVELVFSRHYFEDDDPQKPSKRVYHVDFALPDAAVTRIFHLAVSGTPKPIKPETLQRALLATEAVQRHQRLVLLGDPGSGKSTFLRYLAWALAQRGLDQSTSTTTLIGWDNRRRLLPILLSLRRLACFLAEKGRSETTVFEALSDVLQRHSVQQGDDLLTESLVRGTILLLFDGLDEVPLEAMPTSADRATTLRLVRTFMQRYPQSPAVITCRTRAFREEFRAILDWPTETLAPFTLGQIRHFVPAWYAELVGTGQLDPEQAQRLEQELVATIIATPKLYAMAQTPLLLTMMALLLYKRGTLPRDRPHLYEDLLELLLGAWDKVKEGQSLAEVIGQPDWTSGRFRLLLDRLSYEAHAQATSEDGRGRLPRQMVYEHLITFFEQQQPPMAWDVAQRTLRYFEQRSGLLTPDADDTYVFAHLTLQEHCAGRHMILSRDAANLVMQHRSDDRWREPIFLGLGVVQQSNPYLIESVLRKLLECEEHDRPKPTERWQRDLILAAEIGQDRDWSHLREQRVEVGPLQRDLRTGLVALLADRSQPLPVAERVRAGFLLGDLGDPRFPVTMEEWRLEIERAQADDAGGYFCKVEAGTFWHGDDRKEKLQQASLSYSFQIARYPMTNAGYAHFVETGGYEQQKWWTEQGWQWIQQRQYTQSYRFGAERYNGPSQPVIGISWYEAVAYCRWLTAQGHTQAWLARNQEIRLPTWLEWERAARHTDKRRYPWGDAEPTSEHANHKHTSLDRPLPIGCFSVGASVCGVQDMVGNVQEWTATFYKSTSIAPHKDCTPEQGVIRTSSDFNESAEKLVCGAYYKTAPTSRTSFRGFRVVVAPALTHTENDE